jgi:LPXTG-motif cell wall-anchored protein
MNARNKLTILAVGAIGLACAATMYAQVQTSSDTSVGTATHEVQVTRAEVLVVSGNDLVVKMEDGSIRHISNVPESARATVDGREVGIHDLKPGMKLEKTLVTTTTPTVITTTQTVTGKVWQVSPPNSVILTLEDGQNQQFKIPKGQKFDVDGQQVDAFGLRKGMMVHVTKVVEEPVTQVQQQAKLTGTMPPPPAPPPPDQPVLVVVAQPAPAPAPAPAAPAELPKTGSELPLYGLLGVLLLAAAGCARTLRKSVN